MEKTFLFLKGILKGMGVERERGRKAEEKGKDNCDQSGPIKINRFK